MVARLTMAGVMGLMVTAIALSTVRSGSHYIGVPQYVTRKQFQRIEAAIEKYRKKTHSLPRSLAQLKVLKDAPVNVENDGIIRDSWRRPFRYLLQGDRYRITSYGRDGKPGGVGLDCDLSNLNPKPPESVPTFTQLLFHPLSHLMVVTSFVSGALAFLLTLSVVRPQDLSRQSVAGLAFKLAITFVGAAFAAMLITMLHVPSGH